MALSVEKTSTPFPHPMGMRLPTICFFCVTETIACEVRRIPMGCGRWSRQFQVEILYRQKVAAASVDRKLSSCQKADVGCRTSENVGGGRLRYILSEVGRRLSAGTPPLLYMKMCARINSTESTFEIILAQVFTQAVCR